MAESENAEKNERRWRLLLERARELESREELVEELFDFGHSFAPPQEDDHRCQLCAKSADDEDWIIGSKCCLMEWDHMPHVVHLRCLSDACLDHLLMPPVEKGGWNFNKRHLFDWFTISTSSNDVGQGDATCKLRGNYQHGCLFCWMHHYSISELQQLQQFGFNVSPESASAILALETKPRCKLDFNPFEEYEGVFAYRGYPICHKEDAAAVLSHSLPGTFVDFGGFRSEGFHVVVDASMVPTRQQQPTSDTDHNDPEDTNNDVYSLTVDGKFFIRLHGDGEGAGYAAVPGCMVRRCGIPRLQTIPRISTYFGTFDLPDSQHGDSLTESGYVSQRIGNISRPPKEVIQKIVESPTMVELSIGRTDVKRIKAILVPANLCCEYGYKALVDPLTFANDSCYYAFELNVNTPCSRYLVINRRQGMGFYPSHDPPQNRDELDQQERLAQQVYEQATRGRQAAAQYKLLYDVVVEQADKIPLLENLKEVPKCNTCGASTYVSKQIYKLLQAREETEKRDW